MDDVSRVGVVGFGLMGAGIAEVCARAELDVVVVEANADAAAKGEARLERSLRRARSAARWTAQLTCWPGSAS